ncbi:MAG: CHASE3 domain-containing protein [Syntrophales bacterium]|nr:CHASE3 domain-containing protein [Syntrophales bacterium]
MIQTTINMGKRIAQPVTHLWQRLPLHVQGKILVMLPLLAITIASVFALLGNHQRANIQDDIQRRFQMVRGLNEAVILMVNAETGMRGYLLTKGDEFLQPYATASQKLPSAMSNLRALAEAESSHAPRINKLRLLKRIQLLIDRQMADLTWQRQYVTTSNTFSFFNRGVTFDKKIYFHLANGKRTMEEIRTNLNAMQSEEERLLAERVQEINAIRQRDYFAIILALFIGLGTRIIARYLLTRGRQSRQA